MASDRMTKGQLSELMEGNGTPIRPPAVAVLTIDTRDRVQIDKATGYRIDTTSPNEIYINKQQSLANGYFTRIGLTEINMQWNIPNVIQNGPCKNNTLLLERAAAPGTGVVTGSYLVEIPQGFYTPKELALDIQTLLNTDVVFGGGSWRCEYFERGLNGGNYFAISEISGTIFFRIRPQNSGPYDDLCNIMGLSYPPQQFGESVEGSYASMIYTPYFDIQSDNLTKKQNVRDNSSSTVTGQNLLCRVYLAQPDVNVVRDRTDPTLPQAAECSLVGTRPFALYRQYNIPKQIFWDTQEFINVIDLRLIDYKGRILYNPNETAFSTGTNIGFCGNATNYQLTLQVTET
jgi:hypothetical protein